MNHDYTQEYNLYYSMYGEAYLNQLALEAEYKRQAEEALKATLEVSMKNGEASKTSIGGKLVDYSWESCRENIKALIASASKPSSGVVPVYMDYFKQLISIYREKPEELENLLTLSTLSTMLDSVFSDKGDVSRIASKIVDAIVQEANIEAFYQHANAHNEEANKKGAKLRSSFERGINARVRESYRAAYAINRMHKEGFTPFKWNPKIREALGAKLLECGIKGSGYFEETTVDVGGKAIAGIKACDWLIETWSKNADKLARFAHKFIPTIIPPKPWHSPFGGGYYGEYQYFASLLRIHSRQDNSFLREYKQKLDSVDLSYVYEALNAMQETSFVINKRLLEISEQIVASGGNLGGFPQTEPYAQLPQLTGDYTEEELQEHKRKMVGIIKRNQTRVSKALRATMSLQTARKFAEYDKIYFPWNMDYRGRCYPIPTALSPQGDDITKALLMFAEPQPCQHKDDYKWLAIHGANLAGHDKVSFNERVAWVLENEENIIASAVDPLSYTWWNSEAENDYPMEFLSFCIEWTRLKEYMSQHDGSCVGFVTGLPVCFDGTCSGLQHFSALLRDEIGGHAVNLTPTDSVQDIYSIVADKVNEKLLEDATSGTKDEVRVDKKGKVVKSKDGVPQMKLGTQTLAQGWIMYGRMKFDKDGITRKVCKRSVMTLAYGSGRYGFAENLLEDIIKPFDFDHPTDTPFTNQKQFSVYMAGLIWDSVSRTVVKAVEGMKYLQTIAHSICDSGSVVTWTTPNGLPVQQNYMVMESKVFEMRINGHKKRFYYRESTGNIDSRSQCQGISPNFIHSMDACHLQRVVVECARKGNKNFSMIHDSFGTDLAHAGDVFREIRAQFVKLYDGQDYLQEFYNDIEYLIPEDSVIPDRPSFGNLDIKQVLTSDFCFA